MLPEELAAADRAIGAYALAKWLTARLGPPVAANSVYRMLAELEDGGAAWRVEHAKGWVRPPEEVGTGPALLLACVRCPRIAFVSTISRPACAACARASPSGPPGWCWR
ncbi:MAG: hypothetical protein AVDCRST_MAG39-410 [uncultured Sphingomonadaceae bacterium]|uniref:Uncharacterized protein n=1 Tax=uncultured Sphingomonadaceae bacterium TaxID=169976 RepID=A0A6J4S5M8_9SPHN|nr:MAG: hypothetical protein AVDCRST_MAG39-410 [uncultured Sphingomonadaceae bacterium]